MVEKNGESTPRMIRRIQPLHLNFDQVAAIGDVLRKWFRANSQGEPLKLFLAAGDDLTTCLDHVASWRFHGPPCPIGPIQPGFTRIDQPLPSLAVWVYVEVSSCSHARGIWASCSGLTREGLPPYLPFGWEYGLFSPVCFNGNLSLLELFIFFPGGLSKWMFPMKVRVGFSGAWLLMRKVLTIWCACGLFLSNLQKVSRGKRHAQECSREETQQIHPSKEKAVTCHGALFRWKSTRLGWPKAKAGTGWPVVRRVPGAGSMADMLWKGRPVCIPVVF